MKKLLLLLALLFAPSLAFAQTSSCSGIAQGVVWQPAQWAACFGSLQPYSANLSAWALGPPPAGIIVGTTDTQTLSNKTLASPVITGGNGTLLDQVSGLSGAGAGANLRSAAGAYALNSVTVTVPSIAALRALLIPWDQVDVQAYYPGGTTGGGVFNLQPGGPCSDNSGTVIETTIGGYCYTRQLATAAPYSITWFGTHGDVVVRTSGGAMTAASETFSDPAGTFTAADVGKVMDVANAAAGGSVTVTGAAAGIGNQVVLTVSDYSEFTQQRPVLVSGVAGTTEANGVWTAYILDASHLLLIGTSYSHAWTSGGTVTALSTLHTTITAVASATTVTLSAAATNTVTSAAYKYGTDDTAAIQATINTYHLVYVPNGNYFYNELDFPGGGMPGMVGDGFYNSRLYAIAVSTSKVELGKTEPLQGTHFSDFGLYGNDIAAEGFQFGNGDSNCVASSQLCYVANFVGDRIMATGFSATGAGGFDFIAGQDIHCSNCWSTDNYYNLYRPNTASPLFLTTVTFDGEASNFDGGLQGLHADGELGIFNLLAGTMRSEGLGAIYWGFPTYVAQDNILTIGRVFFETNNQSGFADSDVQIAGSQTSGETGFMKVMMNRTYWGGPDHPFTTAYLHTDKASIIVRDSIGLGAAQTGIVTTANTFYTFEDNDLASNGSALYSVYETLLGVGRADDVLNSGGPYTIVNGVPSVTCGAGSVSLTTLVISLIGNATHC